MGNLWLSFESPCCGFVVYYYNHLHILTKRLTVQCDGMMESPNRSKAKDTIVENSTAAIPDVMKHHTMKKYTTVKSIFAEEGSLPLVVMILSIYHQENALSCTHDQLNM